MKLNNNFNYIFDNTPILGMIHMYGNNSEERVQRALDEIKIFEEVGIDGAIVENYNVHCPIEDIVNVLENSRNSKAIMGVNLLCYESQSIPFATKHGAKFVQIDRIAGKYQSGELDFETYSKYKNENPEIIIMGGVWPKYYSPLPNSEMGQDLFVGMGRCECIVVTGSGTGMETPLDKVKYFREVINNFGSRNKLIIGAGLNKDNAFEQLKYADGAIVGSCLKYDNECSNQLDVKACKEFMKPVYDARNYKKQ